MMWDALMIGTGFVAGASTAVALAIRWYERPSDWCGGTDGGVYLAGYQHGRRDGATAERTRLGGVDLRPGAVNYVDVTGWNFPG